MRKQLVRHLKTFSSAVITGLDPDGYPFSIRCTPEADSDLKVLRLGIPTGIPILPGPGGLLCHYHDEKLWHLRSFLVQGRLEEQMGGWIFKPERFIAGEGLGGQLSLLRVLFQVRRRTRRYLAKRGLPRPKIPWEDINRLRAGSRLKSSPNGVIKPDQPVGDAPD